MAFIVEQKEGSSIIHLYKIFTSVIIRSFLENWFSCSAILLRRMGDSIDTKVANIT